MWFPFPNGFEDIWAVYGPAALAALAAALALGLGWLSGGRFTPAAAGPAAGWAALVPVQALGVALLQPRTPADVLLLPAALALLASAVQGRWARWSTVAVVLVSAWWLAGVPGVGREFWRVGAVATAAAWLLHRVVRGEPARAAVAAVALWAGLWVAGAPPVWVMAGACLAIPAVIMAAGGVALPPVLVVVAAGGACIGGGRLVRGGFNGVDAAALGAVAAAAVLPVLWSWARRRFGAGRRGSTNRRGLAPARARPVRASTARR